MLEDSKEAVLDIEETGYR
jgi:hypothetical protein